MDWGNVIIDAVNKDKVTAHLHLQGSVKDTKKLSWISASPGEAVPVQLIEYDNLITARKLEEGQNFEDFVNKNSKVITQALGDANLRTLNRGDRIQIERRGYFIVDTPHIQRFAGTDSGAPMSLILIPDGSAKCSPFCKVTLKF